MDTLVDKLNCVKSLGTERDVLLTADSGTNHGTSNVGSKVLCNSIHLSSEEINNDDTSSSGGVLLIVRILLDDIVLIEGGLRVVVSFVLLSLLVDDHKDKLVQNVQRANLGALAGSLETGCRELNNLFEVLLEANDVEELLGLEHITDDGAGVQVSLLIVVGTKKADELGDG